MTYPGSDKPRRWDDVQAERDQHLRDMIGPELDDWLEEVTDEARS